MDKELNMRRIEIEYGNYTLAENKGFNVKVYDKDNNLILEYCAGGTSPDSGNPCIAIYSDILEKINV